MARTVNSSFLYMPEYNLIWHVQLTGFFSLYARIKFDMARTVNSSFRYMPEYNLIWHVQLTVLFVICPNAI